MLLNKQFLRFRTSIGRSQGRIIILGTGWAGFKLVRSLNQKDYQVVVVSPSIVEPIRRDCSDVSFYEAFCNEIDLKNNKIKCKSAINDEIFELDYDKLVIACGAVSNTFNITGVKEHAFFLKDINDARKIRLKVIECFENAQQPGRTEEQQSKLLHFAVVGGGPTGVEFSAELHDFITEDLARLYPHLMDKVQMTVYDVADKILGSFDSSLSDYATNKFKREGINIRTGTMVKEVLADKLILKDGVEVPYGLLVWATGLAPNSLVKSLDVPKDKSGRIITNSHLQVILNDGKYLDNVFALGDCAKITENDLPCTAQVANQKAKYLSKMLNEKAKGTPIEQAKPFNYNDMGSMAYVGGWKAVYNVQLKDKKQIKEKGVGAWLFWRSAYFTMAVSLKNKMLIPMYWFLTWIFGRDTSRI